jgi:O-antigen/teichoic acid export membrane protein
MSLRTRTITAGTWTLGGYAINQALRLGTNLVMTRLLVPEAFGVMAIANMLIVGLNLISDIGHRQNIIQSRRGNEPHFLDTAWSMQIVRGGIIAFLIVLLALFLHVATQIGWTAPGSVYADPLLPKVIAALALTAFIAGFESTKVSTTYRSLDLRQVTLLDLYSQFIGAAVTMGWAVVDRSIWALVAGAIAGNVARAVLSHAAMRGHSNRWAWERESVRELFHFGKWIFLSSLLTFLANSGDRLLLGALASPTLLGLYAIAFLLINAFQLAINRVYSAVVYPALSEVARERQQQLKKVYYRLRILLDSGVLLLAGFLLQGGAEVVELLYDSRYADAGSMLQILSVTLVAIRYQATDQCFLALGKPKLLTILNIVRAVSLYVCVPLGFHWFDFDGALWGIVLSQFVSIPLSIFLKARIGMLDMAKEILVLPAYLFGVLGGALL